MQSESDCGLPSIYYLGFVRGAWRVAMASPRPNHEPPLPRPLRDGWAALISTDKTQTGVIRFLIGPWRGVVRIRPYPYAKLPFRVFGLSRPRPEGGTPHRSHRSTSVFGTQVAHAHAAHLNADLNLQSRNSQAGDRRDEWFLNTGCSRRARGPKPAIARACRNAPRCAVRMRYS